MHKIVCNIFRISIILMYSCYSIPSDMEQEKKIDNLKDLTNKKYSSEKLENHEISKDSIIYDLNILEHHHTISYGTPAGAKLDKYKVTKKYFPSLAQNFRQRYIIIHYTSLNNEKSIEVLTKRNVSSHYLINDKDDCEIYQLVDENKRAFHAGISFWRQDNNLNDTSIGIEIVNLGFTERCYDEQNPNECEKIFYDYPDFQIEKTIMLIKNIVERYDIPPTNILAHSDIAPMRKHDPGPKFPWKILYEKHQLGMWYDEDIFDNFLAKLIQEEFEKNKILSDFIYKVQYEFKKFGYDIKLSSEWDESTKKVIRAFQYHFRPEKADGILDIQTYAILLALLHKYPNPLMENTL